MEFFSTQIICRRDPPAYWASYGVAKPASAHTFN